MSKKYNLTTEDIDRIIEMAWEDRTSFDAIERQFGLPEKDIIVLMRQEMKRSSWKMWRKRVQDRPTKHDSTQRKDQSRFKSRMQRIISGNSISKR